MMDLEKCLTCIEERCILSTTPERLEEKKFQKKLRDNKIQKIKAYTKRMKKDYMTLAKREQSLANYDRKPYMNDSDWRHDSNWFLALRKVAELEKQQVKSISELYN